MYLYCMYFAINRSDDDGCFSPVYEINVSDMRTQSKHSMTLRFQINHRLLRSLRYCREMSVGYWQVGENVSIPHKLDC